jgi:putative endopeptidase
MNPIKLKMSISLGCLLMVPCVAQLACADPPGISSKVKPGDDFYAFANDGWLNSTQIPAGKSHWSDRNQIEIDTQQQLIRLAETAKSSAPGSYQRQVADFYAAYMDTAGIEAKGIVPLKPLLQAIDALQNRTALAKALGKGLRTDADPFNFGIYQSPHLFGIAIEHGVHGETTPYAYLMQGGLGSQDRDLYVNTSADKATARTTYEEHISHQLQLAEYDRPSQRAHQVMALETAIARAQLTSEQSAKNEDPKDHWSVSEFSRRAPGLDWPAYFAAAGLAQSKDLVAFQPSAVIAESALVQSFPLDTWKDYMRFHAIEDNADVLPAAFVQTSASSTVQAARDVRDARDASAVRALRAINAINQVLPDALGQMYVAQYFPPATKAMAESILTNVKAAFEKRIETAQWLTPATRAQSLVKLNSIYFGVGYPEKWTSYATLKVEPRDAFANQQRASLWLYKKELSKLGRPNDPQEWIIAPQAVTGTYNPLQNNYNFSAAFLQPPKFDPAGSMAANYGAIGYVFGHELSHFVDTLGALTDPRGAMISWWSATDQAQYDTATAPLVKQYAGYQAFPDLAVNGKSSLSENVADLAGLDSAFDAYRKTLGNKLQDKEYVRQQDRLFFIGYARAWRTRATEQAVREQIATDIHAPVNFRVATVRNMDAWYEAFNVQPGQRYYLDPAARVHIW